ncbi:MAG TPA: winged helix-turn-helix domain-containing protein, partial [Synergistaceae bacterium]|nr:winged helix-turn-helix domain-containing protein [Synergistaceae bacterium]
MIDALITSKTRIKLLFKFFFNPDVTAYLRELAEEFGESTNAVRLELNRFAEAGLINSTQEGRTKMYGANQTHPLFPEIHALVRKTLGIDQMIERELGYMGDLKAVYIVG